MSWRRYGLTILAAVHLLVPSPSLAQEGAAWEVGTQKNTTFADLPIDRWSRLTLFCQVRTDGASGGLTLSSPPFQTQVRNGESYGLNVVVDGQRESFILTARGTELGFEAKDINQRLQLARWVEQLLQGRRIDLALSSIGWRHSQIVANPEALEGLMDRCL